MTSIAKLKDRARKFEQKEDWEAAIKAYQQVLEKEEGADELELELGLYNRIGDLHLRLGHTDDAVSYYETAADKYAESGFFNNAIALCNKALRHRPNRPAIYLKLSRLCAEQGFQTDARRWILEYAGRQNRLGETEEALNALSEFADLSDDPEVRVTLAQQLASHDRPAEAVEELRKAYHVRARQGREQDAAAIAEKAADIDGSVDLASEEIPAAPETASRALPSLDDEDETPPAGSGDALEIERAAADAGATSGVGPSDAPGLEGLETRTEHLDTEVDAGEGGLEGLESTAARPDGADETPDADVGGDLDLETFDRGPEAEDAEPEQPEDVEPGQAEDVDPGQAEAVEPGQAEAVEEMGGETAVREGEEPAGAGVEPVAGAGHEPELAEEEPEPLPLLDTGFDEEAEEEPEPLPLLDDEASTDEVPVGAGEGTEPSGEVDLDAVIERSRDLVARGEEQRALDELRPLSEVDAGEDRYRQAAAVVGEVIGRDPNDLAAHQRRVEYAARTGDDALLLDAYTDLADALARLGAEAKAHAMYERVLDLDPGNEVAREALGVPPGADEDAIDLDAVLREMGPDEVSADVVESSSDDPSFAAMLSQFRAKVTEPVGDDAGDHYDLGLAFKEMGLIDEAIAEFQTALTGGTERLKVYEELGSCFIQKEQYNVALKVFDRALKVPHSGEEELLGVYYHKGQCHEELGQRAEAREAYEKVLSIDETFADVPDRMARL